VAKNQIEFRLFVLLDKKQLRFGTEPWHVSIQANVAGLAEV
jgi:hypothetical protein